MQVEFSGDWFREGGLASERASACLPRSSCCSSCSDRPRDGPPDHTALVGVAVLVAGVGVAHFFTTPDFAAEVATIIGIGVGVDYALFIVTCYRDAVHRTRSPEAAVSRR